MQRDALQSKWPLKMIAIVRNQIRDELNRRKADACECLKKFSLVSDVLRIIIGKVTLYRPTEPEIQEVMPALRSMQLINSTESAGKTSSAEDHNKSRICMEFFTALG